MLYAGSFRDIKPEKYDEIWLVVRQLGAVPRNPLNNIRHVRALSPSKKLLYQSLDLKKRGLWDRRHFDENYAPAFLREMLSSPDAMAKLRELERLSREKDILIACYCPDESECHRSLILKIIAAMRENND